MDTDKKIIKTGILSLELVQAFDQLEDETLDAHQIKSKEYFRSWLLSYLMTTHPESGKALTENERNALKTSFLKLMKKMNGN